MFLAIAGADEDTKASNAVTVTENIQVSVDKTIRESESRDPLKRAPFHDQLSALFKKSISSQVHIVI